MSIYDIKDNNLDFDSQAPKKEKQSQQQPQQTNFETRLLTQKEVEEKWNGKLYKGNVVYIDNKKIVTTAEQIDKLKLHAKYKAQ